MVEIRRVWRNDGEEDIVHVMLRAGEEKQHIKLKRGRNQAMYDFITKHAEVGKNPKPDPSDGPPAEG